VWFAPDCGVTDKMRLAESSAIKVKAYSAPSSPLPAWLTCAQKSLDGPVKYQQMVGVCWAFAISTVMDNALRRAGRQEVIAPMHVLSSCVWNELWQKGKSDSKIILEPRWPYDPVKACKLNGSESEIWYEQAYHVQRGSWRSDPALVAEVAKAKRTGVFNVTKAERIEAGDADQLAAALAQDQAIYASFQYNQKAWGSTSDGGRVIPDHVEEQGGHAVLVVGYRYVGSTRQFLLQNSWSSKWREQGYAWISEAMVRAHMTDALTLEVDVKGAGAATPPPPVAVVPVWPFPMPAGTAAQPSGCPCGQTRDIVAAQLSIKPPTGQEKIYCELRTSNMSQELAAQVVSLAQRVHPLIVAAPVIGAGLGDFLAQNGTSYVDLRGNCSIDLGGRYIAKIRGKTVETVKPARALRTPSYQVLFTVLAEASLISATVRTLALAAGVSRQPVVPLRDRLLELRLILNGAHGYLWTPHGQKRALELWLAGYSTSVRQGMLIGTYRTQDANSGALEGRIAPILDKTCK